MFKPAKPEQGFLKIALYGLQGSGKTATSLLLAEGMAKLINKKVAYIDTERGTDYYAKEVPEREWHPVAFEFDALYSRSLLTALDAVKGLDTKEYGVIVIDSISHLWEAAQLAYQGKKTRAGTIPMYAWNTIKKPYKDFINLLMNLNAHVIICGRQGNDFDKNTDTGESEKVGIKMKAEGETPYEPHILINMYQIKHDKEGAIKGQCVAYFEKDRSGLFTGKSIVEPTFEHFKPLMALLGHTQAIVETDTTDMDAGLFDSEKEDFDKASKSTEIKDEFLTKIQNCESLACLQEIWMELMAKDGHRYRYKTKLFPDDLDILVKMKDEKKKVLVDKIV